MWGVGIESLRTALYIHPWDTSETVVWTRIQGLGFAGLGTVRGWARSISDQSFGGRVLVCRTSHEKKNRTTTTMPEGRTVGAAASSRPPKRVCA